MTLRVLLADDEPPALQRLEVACRRLPGVEVVGLAKDGEAMLDAARTLRPDVVLLDIQMPGLDGLSAAASLDPDDRPDVIFVTAFDQYATAAFDVEAADYLLKPVKFDRLQLAFSRARRRKRLRALAYDAAVQALPLAPDRIIWIAGLHGRTRLDIGDILWIEGADDYVLFHTASRTHIQRATLARLAETLDPGELMRVHRSYIARLGAVTEVERPGRGALALKLSDGARLPVGASYAREVMLALGLPASPSG